MSSLGLGPALGPALALLLFFAASAALAQATINGIPNQTLGGQATFTSLTLTNGVNTTTLTASGLNTGGIITGNLLVSGPTVLGQLENGVPGNPIYVTEAGGGPLTMEVEGGFEITGPLSLNGSYGNSGQFAISAGSSTVPSWTGGSGTTAMITGTSLSASCDSGTASVSGAAVGSPVAVSSTTGADVGGAFSLRASVTSLGTVTVYICGTGTPPTLAYNVTVF
jgi:hypothetical protein